MITAAAFSMVMFAAVIVNDKLDSIEQVGKIKTFTKGRKVTSETLVKRNRRR